MPLLQHTSATHKPLFNDFTEPSLFSSTYINPTTGKFGDLDKYLKGSKGKRVGLFQTFLSSAVSSKVFEPACPYELTPPSSSRPGQSQRIIKQHTSTLVAFTFPKKSRQIIIQYN